MTTQTTEVTVPLRGVRGCIGIRREDKNRWERRAPLAPHHVAQLVKEGIKVLVQPSTIRCFTDQEYEKAGAIVQEDISEASTILAVKPVPLHLLIPDRTYLFFSYTSKGQPYNMHMLDDIIEKNIRLIDYEKIVDANGKRLVKFGYFGGLAGTIDMLHVLGDRLLAAGYATPFLAMSYAKYYPSLSAAKEAVMAVAQRIRRHKLPAEIAPFTIVLTGSGTVGSACKSILDLLPCKYVDPSELATIWNSKDVDRNCIYVAIARPEHMVRLKDNPEGKPFNKEHYYAHPQEYEPIFHETILPYTRVILNCMYWERRFPKLITTAQAKKLKAEGRLPLIGDFDITCDPFGSIGFLVKSTEIDNPVYLYDLDTDQTTFGTVGKGIVMMAVDHLPAEFPSDATVFFGDQLIKFAKEVALSNPDLPYDQMNDLPDEIKRAMITAPGIGLTPNYEYIAELRKQSLKGYNQILLLGAGMVAPPVVEYLMRFDRNFITVGSAILNEAIQLCSPYPRAIPAHINVDDEKHLEMLIQTHDIVISLVPVAFHEKVARMCIKHSKNMITASYISPGMRALDEEAKKAGVFILNELGLDPGIDHMSVMQMLDKIKAENAKLISFSSYCGALPEPTASANPLGYKFSWNPMGVLNAAKNSSKFLDDNVLVEIPGKLLYDCAKEISLYPGFQFEIVPNRDSVAYIDHYGFDKNTIKSIMRGTLRYKGFSLMIRAFSSLGLLDLTPQSYLSKESRANMSWAAVMAHVLKMEQDNADEQAMMAKATELLTAELQQRRDEVASLGFKYTENLFDSKPTVAEEARNAVVGMQRLGMFSREEPISSGAFADKQELSLQEILCTLLQAKLAYQENEHDVVVMHHEFVVETDDHEIEKWKSSLCLYGDSTSSATARTVGLPVAIACKLALDGEFASLRGVLGPVHKIIYDPVMQKLRGEGIRMRESF